MSISEDQLSFPLSSKHHKLACCYFGRIPDEYKHLMIIFSISFSISLAEIDGIADYSIYFPLFITYHYGNVACLCVCKCCLPYVKSSVRILTGKENKFSVPIMVSVIGMVDVIFVQPKLPRIQITYRNQNVRHTPLKGSACFKISAAEENLCFTKENSHLVLLQIIFTIVRPT